MNSKCINLNGWVGLFANIPVFARMLINLNLINLRVATYVCAFYLLNGRMCWGDIGEGLLDSKAFRYFLNKAF